MVLVLELELVPVLVPVPGALLYQGWGVEDLVCSVETSVAI